GSALTLGIRRSSDSSSIQAGSGCASATADESTGVLRYVAELLRFGERLELLQALVLDLADALAGDVEGAPDLVERARVLAVEPVAELEHAPLAVGERREDPLQRLLAKRRLGRLVRCGCGQVGEEVPEL